MYVLKLPNGTLVKDTVSMSKEGCWGKAFPWVALQEGQEWQTRFWKNWRGSLMSAKKLGYQIVKVRLVEA